MPLSDFVKSEEAKAYADAIQQILEQNPDILAWFKADAAEKRSLTAWRDVRTEIEKERLKKLREE
jgi:hypothetical protein